MRYVVPVSYEGEKAAIVEVGLRLYQKGLVTATEGNISMRVAEGHLIDPSAPTSPGQIGWTLHRDEPAVSRLKRTIESLKLGEPRLYSKASDCAPNWTG